MIKKCIDKVKKIPNGAKSAFVYMLATVFSRGLAIITMPIFTRLMTTDQIGEVNLYNSWYSMISAIATLSLTAGGFSVAMKEYENERSEYISSVLTLTSIIASIFSIIYFVSPNFWNQMTGLSEKLMILILIGLFFAPARDFWLAQQRYEYKYKLSGLIMIASALLASTFSIIAVLYLNNENSTHVAEGRLFGNYLVIYSVAFVIWIYLLFRGKTFVNFNYWKFSLKLSLPLVGYSIASQILNVSDRMMISQMVNNSAVGIYSVLYSASSLFTMVWTAINASFVPYLYQNIGKRNKDIKKMSFILLFLYAGVAIAMVYLAPEIVAILATPDYYEAIYIMPPIAAGVFMTSVANMYSNILLYLKSSKYVMFASAVAAILNLVLNYICIPRFGYMAAAYTTMFAYLIMLLLLATWAKRMYKKQKKYQLEEIYDNRKIGILSIITITLLLLGMIIYRYSFFRYICVGVLIIVSIFVWMKKQKSDKNRKHVKNEMK